MSPTRATLTRRLVVKGGESGNAFLDNDDIRPLALKDRTWTQRTYLTFWFSAAATGETNFCQTNKQILM